MNFLKNLAFQFWPLVVMVAASPFLQALGQGWVTVITGFMIAGGVVLWSLASRAVYEARMYRLGRDCYIRGLKLQIDYTLRGQEICRGSGIPGLAESYEALLEKQKMLLRHAEELAREEDGK